MCLKCNTLYNGSSESGKVKEWESGKVEKWEMILPTFTKRGGKVVACHENQKVRQMHACMQVCMISALCLHKSALSMHQVCIFTTGLFFPEKRHGGMQTWCRARAYSAHFVQTWCTLFLKKCASGALCTLGPSVQVCKNLACTLCTLFLWCAKSAQCLNPSQANLVKHLAIQHLCTRRAFRSRPGSVRT
jgi:hypothetical protein